MYIFGIIFWALCLGIISIKANDEVCKIFTFILVCILLFVLICLSSFLIKLLIVSLILISLSFDKFNLKNLDNYHFTNL